MTPLTPARLAELDALISAAMIPVPDDLGRWDRRTALTKRALDYIAACPPEEVAALSAALRAAWVERDVAKATAFSHEKQLVDISNYLGKDARHHESGTISGLVIDRVKELEAERDRLAARLAEAEELLRPFAESRCDNFGASRNSHCVAWNEKHGDDPETRVVLCGRCRAAAFLARTEPAK